MEMTRRDALKGIGALTIGTGLGAQAQAGFDVAAIERDRVIAAANAYLKERPTPDNSLRALMRFSVQMPALAAAWKLTGEMSYARHASRHLRLWFCKPDTKMNPPRLDGGGIGIIDTIHLVEVARAIELIRDLPLLAVDEWKTIHAWFAEYPRWMTIDKSAQDDRDAKDHRATCWVMQVAAFAHLTKNEALLASCRERYKTVLLPGQLGMDGSFPLEVKRTNSYCYSLFNLEAMATICRIASTPDDNLWTFELEEPEPPSGRSMAGGEALGRGMRLAMNFMTPYIRDKSKWPYSRDVMHDDQWPMRQQSLLFAGLSLDRPDDLELWKTLPADSTVEEVVRHYFIRQPILWV